MTDQVFPILRADGSVAGMSTIETVNALLARGFIEERISLSSGVIYFVPTDAGQKAFQKEIESGKHHSEAIQ